jgi:hypothetical protein
MLARRLRRTDIVLSIFCLVLIDCAYTKDYNPPKSPISYSSKSMHLISIIDLFGNNDKVPILLFVLYWSFQVLLQGVPRNALLEDIDRFLCGTNFEPPFESFIR